MPLSLSFSEVKIVLSAVASVFSYTGKLILTHLKTHPMYPHELKGYIRISTTL